MIFLRSCRATAYVAALFLLVGLSVHAEMNVTVTITGSVDEILPVLQHLKDMGFGATESADEDVFRMQLHSESSLTDLTADELVVSDDTIAAEPEVLEPVPEPEPEPILEFLAASVEPDIVTIGGSMRILVSVVDKFRQIDTIVATVRGINKMVQDLYDDGTHGDVEAGDGLWSTDVVIKPPMTIGAKSIEIVAYDIHGDFVRIDTPEGDAVSLTTDVSFRIR